MTFDNQVHADFDHARRKASWRSVINRLMGRRTELLRFEEVRRQLGLPPFKKRADKRRGKRAV